MFIYIQSFLIVVLEIICCKIFFETFGIRRKENGIWKNYGIIMGLIFFVYFSAMFLEDLFFIKQVLIIIVTAVLMVYYLKIGFWKSIILSALFQGLLLIVDYFTLLLNISIFHSMFEIEKSYYVLVVLGKAILFLAVLIIRKNMGQDYSAVLSDTEWLRFIFFPVFTICVITGMIVTSGGIRNQKQEEVFFVIAFGLAGMNIVVFYLINDILKREVKIREDEIFRLQVKSQTGMYRSVSENFDKQRKKTHEYKNQMTCIKSLIKKKNYDELEEYITGISDDISKELYAVSTNHVIVDAILNTKYQEMAVKNIVFVFRINDLSEINISDEDIVVILSNLLNNAIEACEKCQKKKIIKLKFLKEDDSVILSVKNTYENKILYKGEEIQTSKKDDTDEHGIGIKNIVETITKYGGSYVIRNNDHEFYFSIIIPQ